jgi:hypothetical protein
MSRRAIRRPGNVREAAAIAIRIYASDPRLVAIAGGREVLRRTRTIPKPGLISSLRPRYLGICTVSARNHAVARGYFVRPVEG